MVIVVVLIVGRLLGLIEIPAVWFVSTIGLEIALGLIETTAFILVLRHVYKRHRADGATRWDAYSRACGDELYAAGAPSAVVTAVERVAAAQGRLIEQFVRPWRNRSRAR